MAASRQGDLVNDHNPAHNANAALNRLFLSSISEGDIDEAGRLLEEGANCDAMSVNGCVSACTSPRRLKIRNKACPDHMLKRHFAVRRTRAVHISASVDDVRMLYFLCAAGADVNVRELAQFGGHTPLHTALIHGSLQSAALLLEAGADMHAQEAGTGVTPLHICARLGHNNFAKALLALGVDAAAVDAEGSNASAVADSVGNKEFLGIAGMPAPVQASAEEVAIRMELKQKQAALLGAKLVKPKGKKKKRGAKK